MKIQIIYFASYILHKYTIIKSIINLKKDSKTIIIKLSSRINLKRYNIH